MSPDHYIAEALPSGGWLWVRPPPIVGEPLWTEGPATIVYSPAPLAQTSPRALRELDALADLPIGWDGMRGVAPDPDTIASARQLYWLAQPAAEPAAHCAGDGEVSFVWRQGDRYLELGVDADGAVSFYGRDGAAEPVLGDLDGVPDSLPESLKDFLGGFKDGVRVRA